MSVGADESGNFDFAIRPDGRYFMVVTVVGDENDLNVRLNRLATDLGDPKRIFHANADHPSIRARLFMELRECQLRIDATIVDKAIVPDNLRGDVRLYSEIWTHHFTSILPMILYPNKKVLLHIASIGTKKKRTAFQKGIAPPVMRAYGEIIGPLLYSGQPIDALVVPAYMSHFAKAEEERILQVTDYCAWAIHRKWERPGDTRSYQSINSLIGSERLIRVDDPPTLKWGTGPPAE